MSDDICERLVRFANKVCISTDLEVEAATEITRLREDNARLRSLVKSAYYEGWSATRGYAPYYIGRYWSSSKACAAICEGGEDG